MSTYQEKSTVRFQLELSRGAPSYNSGYIEGEFLLKNRKGKFKALVYDKLCEIDFLFKRNEAVLSMPDHSECGFGYNVYATGTYKLISHDIPVFNIEDPRFGNN